MYLHRYFLIDFRLVCMSKPIRLKVLWHRKAACCIRVHGVPKGVQKEKKMSGFGAYIFRIGIPRGLIL